MRELAGNAAHKAAYNTANKFANGSTNTLKQIAALIDKPFQAGNLSQCTNCCQYKSKLGNNNTYTKHANHSSRNQSGDRTKSRYNCSQKTDSDNPLKQSCGINPLQSVNDAGKERHEHVDGRLNKTGQITGKSFKHTDEELEQGIYNLWSILDQRLKNTRDKL